ncbi:hypothetical protein AA12717_3427 [Gluconacetobacter sacchari DSM 12717]|uniref:Uncharacterized protein n=2 Tax=Gluconacetobacter sacchari TaxID=92759 RepID=A0A7W4IG41_9PROT|nr:hypothetical protein [Gluconacetobacter sacchari]MBB2162157.1 hypothetical protein [Gluconacetobacter sacchari]GBQ30056.1 hypothetical protein AA12717_3427 [Gluconacetobacter sacchari DSM 12717]
MASALPGLLIAASVVLSGLRWGLPWQGGLVVLALLAAALDGAAPVRPCLAALFVVAGTAPLAWGLARLEDRPPAPGERISGVGGGLLLTILAVLAVPRGLIDAVGRPELIAALVAILCGVLAAAVRRSVVGQCAGLAGAVNGLLLLAGLAGRDAVLAGAVALQGALLLVAFVCLRRIAWGREVA